MQRIGGVKAAVDEAERDGNLLRPFEMQMGNAAELANCLNDGAPVEALRGL
ncbi:MAG: hypothetical protein IPM60_00100 [Rhodospirillales bacterium]|nr:hypothetical protein [Rhodospirillales bacterium]